MRERQVETLNYIDLSDFTAAARFIDFVGSLVALANRFFFHKDSDKNELE